MKLSVVIATGASLTDEQTAAVYNSDRIDSVIAVSNAALTKCPWAEAMVSYDTAWWVAHPEYLKFKGRRFGAKPYNGIEHFDLKSIGVNSFVNSGLLGMYVAREIYKPDRIALLGFDMHRRNGQHFFGPHLRNLKNTSEHIFEMHIKQFESFSGCEVVNCTPGSDLKRFPMINLYDII